MNYDAFVGHVQNRAHLQSREDAEAVICATLKTFGERLQPLTATMVASQLPPDVGKYLDDHRNHVDLTLSQFYDRIAQREKHDVAEAKAHAECVLETLCEAIAYAEVVRLRQQVPEEFRGLLHFAVGEA